MTNAPGAAIKLAVINFGAKSIPACAPILAYTTNIPPAIQAKLPLMLAKISLFVIVGKYGRIITCASTCPTNALATLLNASAPLTRIIKFIALAITDIMRCMIPK